MATSAEQRRHNRRIKRRRSMAISAEQRRHNRRIERLWRQGKITFEAFDWWLRHVCGV